MKMFSNALRKGRGWAGGQTRAPPGGSTLFLIIPSPRFLNALPRFFPRHSVLQSVRWDGWRTSL